MPVGGVDREEEGEGRHGSVFFLSSWFLLYKFELLFGPGLVGLGFSLLSFSSWI